MILSSFSNYIEFLLIPYGKFRSFKVRMAESYSWDDSNLNIMILLLSHFFYLKELVGNKWFFLQCRHGLLIPQRRKSLNESSYNHNPFTLIIYQRFNYIYMREYMPQKMLIIIYSLYNFKLLHNLILKYMTLLFIILSFIYFFIDSIFLYLEGLLLCFWFSFCGYIYL